MSNWGIGLLFGFGPGARPEVVSIRDVEAHCPECGHEVVVRRYDASPFHSITVARLRALLERAPSGTEGTCPQCDAPVGEADVVRWVVHYGFPSGRGLIQGFAEREGERRWLLSPHEAIDVQLVPTWDIAVDQSRREVDTLTRPEMREVFGRAFNAKEETRELVASGAASPGAWRMSDRLAVVAVPRSATDATALAAAGLDGPLVAEPLVRGGVAREGFPGAPAEWLQGVTPAPDVDWWGVASRRAVIEAARAIPRQFPIELRFEGDDDAETLALVSPDERWSATPPTLDVEGVAREAARSVLDPGDATRLEIDRLLLALTGLWVPDPAGDDPAGPESSDDDADPGRDRMA